jgi:hypothetical protein
MLSFKRIINLFNKISKNSKILTNYLSLKGIKAPLFNINKLDKFLISLANKELYKAKLKIIAITKELYNLLLSFKEGF